MRFARACLLLLLPILGSYGLARASQTEAEEPGRFSLSGFGTLGLARADSDEVEYIRDLSQPRGLRKSWSAKIDSVLGVQAEYRFTEQVDGVVQAITRYRYDGGYDPEISWAFLRYDPNPNISLRMGRLGTEFFMLSDSRLVGFANLTVRPPPDFYHSLIFSYHDGLDASLTWPIADDLMGAKLYIGVSPEISPFIDPLHWNLEGSPIVGGHVDYTTGDWRFRAGHARIRFSHELPFDAYLESAYGIPDFLAQVPDLRSKDTWSGYTSFGAVYERGPLQMQFMLNRIDHETEAYEDGKAGYCIAAYRFGDFTPYIGYSRVRTKTSRAFDEHGTLVDAIAAEMVRQTHTDQNTLFLGVRWDVRPNLALKAQIDRIDADPTSRFPFRESFAPTWRGSMTVYSLALDFVF